MGLPSIHSQSAASQSELDPVQRRATRVSLLQCLVVSPSGQRSRWFRRGAEAGGWQAMEFQDAEAARLAASRIRFRLAVVDLGRTDCKPPPGLRELCETLAAEGTALLVICGNDGDAVEEIWAHQLGAWLYLPGVDADSDLKMLCEQARVVVEKLDPAPHKGSAQAGTGRTACG